MYENHLILYDPDSFEPFELEFELSNIEHDTDPLDIITGVLATLKGSVECKLKEQIPVYCKNDLPSLHQLSMLKQKITSFYRAKHDPKNVGFNYFIARYNDYRIATDNKGIIQEWQKEVPTAFNVS